MTRLALWKEELRDLIKEAAKTFVGFQNVESIRKALDIVLGLISFSLVKETEGQEDPAKWLEYLVRTGFKELVKKAISQVQKIHQDPTGKPYSYLFEMDKPIDGTKEHLLAFATSRTGPMDRLRKVPAGCRKGHGGAGRRSVASMVDAPFSQGNLQEPARQ